MKNVLMIIMATLLSLFSGCSLFEQRQASLPPSASPAAKYANQDLDSLLNYGDELAKLDADGRLAECRHLQELGTIDQNLGWVLHLMLVQALTEDCGDTKETLSRLKLTMSLVQDDRLRQFIAFQQQVLLRLEKKSVLDKSEHRQLKIPKQKIQKSHQEVKTRENAMKSRDSEMKRLQNKLDLLKSIEPNLGNPSKPTNEIPKPGN
jgi:vacuolar-type H+-ATPase subunit I/STV1